MIPLTTKSRSAIRIFWRSLETTHSAIALVPLEDAGQHQQWSCQRLQQHQIFFSPPFAGNREIVKRRPTCSSDQAVGVPLRICAVLSKHHSNLRMLIPSVYDASLYSSRALFQPAQIDSGSDGDRRRFSTRHQQSLSDLALLMLGLSPRDYKGGCGRFLDFSFPTWLFSGFWISGISRHLSIAQ